MMKRVGATSYDLKINGKVIKAERYCGDADLHFYNKILKLRKKNT
jgi:hypothetical protein